MQLLKLHTKGKSVKTLQKLLNQQGYGLTVDGDFGLATLDGVKDFQQKKNLAVDGIVYTRTWINLANTPPDSLSEGEDRYLSEADLKAFATTMKLELAVVKAVKKVESNGRGFLDNGMPKILFEGHIFWRELKNRGYNPEKMTSGYEDVLYKHWTKQYYKGGAAEWQRLEKAISIKPEPGVAEAAYAAASYGLFQIMGFHYKTLRCEEILAFVAQMREDEKAQLDLFGIFMTVNGLTKYLQFQWAEFARQYNGSGYKKNKYDKKLEKAYFDLTHVDIEAVKKILRSRNSG